MDCETSFADAKFIDLPSPNTYINIAAGDGCPTLGRDRQNGYRTQRRSRLADSDGMVGDPIVLIQWKPYPIVVEPAPWRLEPGTTPNIKARIIADIYERLNRWCVNSADLTIFTQAEYQQSLLTKRDQPSHIINAS